MDQFFPIGNRIPSLMGLVLLAASRSHPAAPGKDPVVAETVADRIQRVAGSKASINSAA
jgi:hypothetical protein